MNKKIATFTIGLVIFGAGVFFGKQIQKADHNKRTTYAGILQVYTKNGKPELYLDLDVLPEKIAESADVIFRVNKIA